MSQIIKAFKLKTKKIQGKDWESFLYSLIGNPIQEREIHTTMRVCTEIRNLGNKLHEHLKMHDLSSFKFPLINDPLKFDIRKFVSTPWYKRIIELIDEITLLNKEFFFLKDDVTIDDEFMSRLQTQPNKIEMFKFQDKELKSKEQFVLLVETNSRIEEFNNVLFSPLYDVSKYIKNRGQVLKSYAAFNHEEETELFKILEYVTYFTYKSQAFSNQKIDVFAIIESVGNFTRTTENSANKLISLVSKISIKDSTLFAEEDKDFVAKSQKILDMIDKTSDKCSSTTEFVMKLLDVYSDDNKTEAPVDIRDVPSW